MTNEQIEAIRSELQVAVAQFEALSGRDVPNNIDDAAKALWEFAEDRDLAAHVAYFAHDQRADRKRLIRFGDALQMIQEMEEDLIQEMVQDELDIIVAKALSVSSAFKWLAANWENLPELLGQVWDTIETGWEWFTQGVPALIRNLVLTVALPAFYKVAKKAFIIRERYPARLRKKALPQRIVERSYRRKVSRL